MAIAYNTSIVRNGLVLYLDAANVKSYPGQLGSELVTNSTVTQIDGTSFNVIRDATQNVGLALCDVEAGKTYYVDYLISSYTGTTGGTFRINNSAGNLTPTIGISSAGRFNAKFTASVSGSLTINGDNTGTNFQVDYASVREVVSGTGLSWFDLSGNGNNGALVNAPVYSAINSGIFSFNGTDEYVSGLLPAFAVGSSATIEAFVQLNNVTNLSAIFSHGRSGMSFGMGMVILNSNLRFRNSGNDYALSAPTTLSIGQWYHLVLSITGSQTTGYVNGLFQGTTNQVITTNAITDYHISRRSSNSSTEYVNGNVATIRVYNRALTEQEVQQNFNALRGRYGI